MLGLGPQFYCDLMYLTLCIVPEYRFLFLQVKPDVKTRIEDIGVDFGVEVFIELYSQSKTQYLCFEVFILVYSRRRSNFVWRYLYQYHCVLTINYCGVFFSGSSQFKTQ